MEITLTGAYDISADDYHADPCPIPSLSSSMANILLQQSPAHAWAQHPRLNKDYKPETSARMDLGVMAHALLLEGDNSRMTIVDADDWRAKDAKSQRDAARAIGNIPILRADAGTLERMVDVARKFLTTSELGSFILRQEQTFIWTEGDVWLRARMDWHSVDHALIIDYKSTTDASPEAFIRQIARMGYDVQAAFYPRAIERLFGTIPRFVFMAQEIEPPYACSLVSLSNPYIEIATAKVDEAIKIWRDCQRNNRWPAYSNRIHYADPPAWVVAGFEAKRAFSMGEWQ